MSSCSWVITLDSFLRKSTHVLSIYHPIKKNPIRYSVRTRTYVYDYNSHPLVLPYTQRPSLTYGECFQVWLGFASWTLLPHLYSDTNRGTHFSLTSGEDIKTHFLIRGSTLTDIHKYTYIHIYVLNVYTFCNACSHIWKKMEVPYNH